MERAIPNERGYTPKRSKRNNNLSPSPRLVRAALSYYGLSLADWAKAHGYGNATQVSLALHHRRHHAKARMIRQVLAELADNFLREVCKNRGGNGR